MNTIQTMMKFLWFTSTIGGSVVAMRMPRWINETVLCTEGQCEKDDMPYEWISDVQAGYQWDDAGGYCGSWATQRAVLGKGAWISQQQVRDHAKPCGGHGTFLATILFSLSLYAFA